MAGFEVSTEASMRPRAMLRAAAEVGWLSAQKASKLTIRSLVRAGSTRDGIRWRYATILVMSDARRTRRSQLPVLVSGFTTVLNTVGGALRALGAPLDRLSEERLLHAAQRKTGLSDFGDGGFGFRCERSSDRITRRADSSASPGSSCGVKYWSYGFIGSSSQTS
jgi:hypothetical protein